MKDNKTWIWSILTVIFIISIFFSFIIGYWKGEQNKISQGQTVQVMQICEYKDNKTEIKADCGTIRDMINIEGKKTEENNKILAAWDDFNKNIDEKCTHYIGNKLLSG